MQDEYLLLLGLCCIAPVLIFLVVAFFAVKSGYRYLSPVVNANAAQMQVKYAALQKDNPTASPDELVQKVIHQEAMKCGWVGALTGLGGIFFLPFGLAIDFYTSLRIQREMVYFIASVYGHDQITAGSREHMLINQIIMTGGSQAMNAFRRVASQILQKAFAKIIPFLGAILGFGVSYTLARATGEAAKQYYSGHLQSSLQAASNNINQRLKRP